MYPGVRQLSSLSISKMRLLFLVTFVEVIDVNGAVRCGAVSLRLPGQGLACTIGASRSNYQSWSVRIHCIQGFQIEKSPRHEA